MADITKVDPKEIIDDLLIRVGKFIIPTDIIILDYYAIDRVALILENPFLDIRRSLIDVIEGTLKMILNNEEIVFRVYKGLNTLSHYRDLYLIIVIKVDEYGVGEFKLVITSLDFLIEFLKLINKPQLAKLE